VCNMNNILEILEEIVTCLLWVQNRILNNAALCIEQSMPIGGCAKHVRDADHVVSAGLVLDDDRRLVGLRNLRGYKSSHDIGLSSRRKWNNQAYRLRWKRIGPSHWLHGDRRSRNDGLDDETTSG